METVYFYSAVIGGGLLVLQVLMLLIGGGDSDFDADKRLQAGSPSYSPFVSHMASPPWNG